MKITFYSIIAFLIFSFLNIERLSAQQSNLKIREVYGPKMQDLVQNEPEHVKFLTDLLETRIKIMQSPSGGEDKYTRLSAVPLLNKYNQTLKRDLVFDPNTFNPLKYDLKFTSGKTEVYRVDGTDYLIIITPQSLK